MELPLNERIREMRTRAGYLTVADMQRKLAELNMPIPYRRLLNLEKRAIMPTPYEFEALEAATGADPTCLITGRCEQPAFKDLQQHAVQLDKKQIQHLVNLGKAHVPVIKQDLRT